MLLNDIIDYINWEIFYTILHKIQSLGLFFSNFSSLR